jgi:hypothetical protein
MNDFDDKLTNILQELFLEHLYVQNAANLIKDLIPETAALQAQVEELTKERDGLKLKLQCPAADLENAREQNQRMRIWFADRTGLESTMLSDHMKVIDEMLNDNTAPEPSLLEIAKDIFIKLYEVLQDEKVEVGSTMKISIKYAKDFIQYVRDAEKQS